ncbi:MAG: hypothetical protein MOB07_04355 [Acidobacteria bacterium]|nr:hypothetical protein [Acidobacteriota bacterium]
MASNTLLDSPVWKQFDEEARKRRENPEDLVTVWIRQCLEIWEDESLDSEIGVEVRQSGYQEGDAVDLIRRFRCHTY